MPVWLIRYAPYLIAVVAVVGGVLYFGHVRYKAGEAHCMAESQKAALVAAQNYQAEVNRQQSVIADLNAKLETERRKKNKVLTVYREAVQHDPDCQAWATAAVRCPLRLRDHPDNHPATPPNP